MMHLTKKSCNIYYFLLAGPGRSIECKIFFLVMLKYDCHLGSLCMMELWGNNKRGGKGGPFYFSLISKHKLFTWNITCCRTVALIHQDLLASEHSLQSNSWLSQTRPSKRLSFKAGFWESLLKSHSPTISILPLLLSSPHNLWIRHRQTLNIHSIYTLNINLTRRN